MSEQEQEPSRPGQDYHTPDPPPPLPWGTDAITDDTKLILELYAAEIREHASHIQAIYGLSPTATSIYKQHCFDAAKDLEQAAQILRQNKRLRPLMLHRAAAAAAPPTPAVLPVATKSLGERIRGLFGRGLAPGLILLATYVVARCVFAL